MKHRVHTAAFVALLCIPFVFHSLSAQSERHILLEEFSTARCGFCPDGTLIAAQIVRDHPSVIWVTHHAGFGVDSMTSAGSKAIASAFTNFAPGACIDRGVYPVHVSPYIEQYGKIATTRSKWDSVITAHLDDEQFAELTITSGYDAASMQATVSVDIEFSALPTPGDIRMNLFVVEDSVIGFGEGYDQKNYYNSSSSHPLYQAGDPIVGYAHHRVVSAVPTGDWGDASTIPADPQLGTTYTYTWTGPLAEVWDPSNVNRPDIISFVAFLSYYDEDPLKRQVIHSAEAHLSGVSQTGDLPDPGTALTVSVYPNPARDEARFTVTHSTPTGGQLTVTDACGRVVKTYHVPPGIKNLRLPTRQLTAGIYFYRFSAGSADMAVGKFLVL